MKCLINKKGADELFTQGMLTERGHEILLHNLTWKEIYDKRKNEEKQ